MKKILILSVVLISTIGCNSVKDVEYCRNMKINDTLTRSELVRLNVAEQRKIFNDLPAETKCDLYIFKLTEDIKNAGLSEGEKAELDKLVRKLKPSIYEKTDDSFVEYSEKFEQKMRSEYGWTEKELFKYTGVVMTAEEYDAYLAENNIN